VPRSDWPSDGPLDLVLTLRSLVRGHGDRTIRLAAGRAWWTTRTADGPATVLIKQRPDRVSAEAFGPGAERALQRVPGLLGLAGPAAADGRAQRTEQAGADHPLIGELRRRHPGIRIPRTEAVLDALLPAILEQKVTGVEARRAWQGLVRAHGEPAPGPPGLGLMVTPDPETLARLPYYAYHPFGIEARRADLLRRVAARAAWFEAITELPLAKAQLRLQSIPGIGPWTSAEVAVRALGDPDAVSVGDVHLPNLVGWALAREPRATDARMLELLEPYRGERALVIKLLESSGLRPPRYGARLTPRAIEGI
jgi:3-methyladenine DNA glycosylase/8-oxoguanine DNA glycosylase